MPFISQLAHYLEAYQRLGNPFHVFFKRALGKSYDLMTVEDRRSGIRCICTMGAYHAFGGIWHTRDYDVPRVPIRPGDTVLDIGANQGFFTCYAAHKGATVYAFEPNPEFYERLLANVEMNRLSDRVVAKPWAISDQEGTVELLVSNELGGAMTTINREFARNSGISVRNTLEVPCRTLAQVFDLFSLSHVRLCKIDAEGSEIAMLRTLAPSHLAAIDSFAAEIHPEAYSLAELAKVIIDWGTHQIGFNDEGEFSPPIIRAISNRILLDGIPRPQDAAVAQSA